MTKVVLIGNFGVGNLGDEAIVEFYYQYFPEIDWQVVSHTPTNNELHRLPLGVRSFFTPWHRTIKAIFRCDAVVVGGGTLLTDSESVFACLLWSFHILTARFLRKPIHLAYQGIGPCSSVIGTLCTKLSLASATSISVRDARSLQYVESLGFTNALLVFDPVILLLPESYTAVYTHRSLVIIPRHNSTDAFIDLVKTSAKELWDEVLILSFHPSNADEVVLTNQLQTLFSQSSIHAVTSVREAIEYIGSATLVISQRFHGTLIAKALGKPVQTVSLAHNDKHTAINEAMNDLEQCRLRALQGIDALRNSLQKKRV